MSACSMRYKIAPTEFSNHFNKAIPVVCADYKKHGCSARGSERYACDAAAIGAESLAAVVSDWLIAHGMG